MPRCFIRDALVADVLALVSRMAVRCNMSYGMGIGGAVTFNHPCPIGSVPKIPFRTPFRLQGIDESIGSAVKVNWVSRRMI